jgi:hypothetical protein
VTVTELQNQLLERLTGASGRGRGHWRRIIGEIRVFDIARENGSNWEIRPTGSFVDVQAANAAAESLRDADPVLQSD